MRGEDILIGTLPWLVLLFLGLAIFAVTFLVWWKIVSRTGYSGWLSLLMFIPIANLVLLLILAFVEWPIQRELQDLRRRVTGSL